MLQYYWSKLLKKMRGSAIMNSSVHKTSKVEAGSQVVHSTFDRYSFCGYDCQIINCTVGAFTSISNNVVIGGGVHPMNWVGMSPVFYEGRDSVKTKFAEHKRPTPLKTKIGNDVWIGQGAILKAGVVVGDGAVIGMGSIVTKDVPPYCIFAGNPAHFIRKRFDDSTVEKLLDIQWWEWDEQYIKKMAPFFNDINLFLVKVLK